MTDLLQENRPQTLPESEFSTRAAGVVRTVQKKLSASRYSALKGVVCDDFGGLIRLRGRVPSHYLKQVAFAVADEAVGSHPILNEIKVVAGDSVSPFALGDTLGSGSGSGWFRSGRRV